MRKYLAWAVIVLLAAAVASVAHGDAAKTMSVTYPEYRNDRTFFLEGEPWEILFDDSFGSIVYRPGRMGSHRFTVNLDDTLIEAKGGTVRITRSVQGKVTVSCPGGTFLAETSMGEVRVTFKGKAYRFKTPSADTVTFEGPDDVITYRSSGGAGELVVSGRRGAATYKSNLNDFTVVSQAGTSRYRALQGGGYEVDGVPVEKHPYRYWGVAFMLPEWNVGAIIEVSRFVPIRGIPRFFDLDRALVMK